MAWSSIYYLKYLKSKAFVSYPNRPLHKHFRKVIIGRTIWRTQEIDDRTSEGEKVDTKSEPHPGQVLPEDPEAIAHCDKAL